MRTNLFEEDEGINYQIEIVRNQASVDFVVYELERYEHKDERDYDVYLKGTIKWDGCSHLHFGDEGYLHLCGKYFFDIHIKIMKAVWNICTAHLEPYQREIAGELFT